MWKTLSLFMLALFCSMNVFADASIPEADSDGAQDSPLVGRFAGSFIVSYTHKDFDELALPLSALEVVEGKTDNHNNNVFAPKQVKQVEGQRTRLVYVAPAGASPLEALRNYQQELTGKGGKTLFECKDHECGGDPTRSSSGGGGDMSLAMYLLPEDRIQEEAFSNGNCAQTSWISEQRYAVVELPERAAYVSVLTYLLKDDTYCKAFNDRAIAVVDILQTKGMDAKMVTLKAEEMAQSLAEKGSVALYGIYFDSGKATIKPESKETLEQIAELLKTPALKLLVVGHTDNVGSFEANMKLSDQRAAAVMQALTTTYGIEKTRLKAVGVSFACPVATNATDEGRAKNRRVELVAN